MKTHGRSKNVEEKAILNPDNFSPGTVKLHAFASVLGSVPKIVPAVRSYCRLLQRKKNEKRRKWESDAHSNIIFAQKTLFGTKVQQTYMKGLRNFGVRDAQKHDEILPVPRLSELSEKLTLRSEGDWVNILKASFPR